MPNDAPSPPPEKKPPDVRTVFAAERTVLAWIRTGLALMGFGFVIARFGLFLRKLSQIRGMHMHGKQGTSASMYIGVAVVLIGVLVNIAAAYRHGKFMAKIKRGETPEGIKGGLPVIIAVGLAVVGVAIAVYLIIIST